MKKHILFSLIGAVVIFVWQFLAHAFPNFHSASSQYTPYQDEILQKLEAINLDEGMYHLGQPDPSLSQDEIQKEWDKKYMDKPWATLNYRHKMDMNMAMPMIRSLLVDIVIAWFLFWIFLQQKEPNLKNRVLTSVFIGLIAFLFLPYTEFIWYKEPGIFAYLADAVVPWLILGLIGHKMAGK